MDGQRMRYFTYMKTDFCDLLLAGDESSLTEVSFVGRKMKGFTAGRREEETEEETPVLARARRQLEEYFAGEREAFELPLSARGTPFQKRVWDELLKIPYGETITYGELAARIGNPDPRSAG